MKHDNETWSQIAKNCSEVLEKILYKIKYSPAVASHIPRGSPLYFLILEAYAVANGLHRDTAELNIFGDLAAKAKRRAA